MLSRLRIQARSATFQAFPDVFAAERAARFSFLRRDASPASHKWQNGHATPLSHPCCLFANAHGLHMPRSCPTEPKVGNSAVPAAGAVGGPFRNFWLTAQGNMGGGADTGGGANCGGGTGGGAYCGGNGIAGLGTGNAATLRATGGGALGGGCGNSAAAIFVDISWLALGADSKAVMFLSTSGRSTSPSKPGGGENLPKAPSAMAQTRLSLMG